MIDRIIAILAALGLLVLLTTPLWGPIIDGEPECRPSSRSPISL